jgi:hypothetical protein
MIRFELTLACLLVVNATTEKEYFYSVPVIDEMPPLPNSHDGTQISNLEVFVVPHSHDDTVKVFVV